MTLNHDCVRALLLWLEENQDLSTNGKAVVVHLKNVYGRLPQYSPSDVNLAASYLVQKNLISLRDGQTVRTAAPRAFSISGITAAGYDYLAAVKDESLWNRIKEKLGSTALASVPNVIAVAAEFLAKTL